MVLLIWMLPILIAHSPLLNWIVGMAAADLDGQVRIGSASLGWFSPIELGDIEVRDAQEQPVVSISEVHGDRSLLQLLWNPSRTGWFRIVAPQIEVILREDGSNLEDLLAKYLVPNDEPSSAAIEMGLEVVDGTISVIDARTQRSWRVERFHLALTMSANPDSPLKLETSGNLADPRRPGRFKVVLKLQDTAFQNDALADSQPAAGASGDLDLELDALPLAMLESLVGRFVAEPRLDGRLSSTMQCRWSGAEGIDRAAIQGSLVGDDLLLAGPWLGKDRVVLKRLETVCQVDWHEDTLRVDRATVECDLGHVSLSGALDVSPAATQDMLTAISHQSYEVAGQVDLARLARMLPDTLHIQEGSEITSGQLEVAMASRPGSDGMVWLGRVEARDLVAQSQGRRLVWQQPILVDLAAHETKDGPIVDNLKCQSSFLQLDATGTPENLTATADFDLDQLASQLAGVVDLGGIRMAGAGTGRFTWRRGPSQQFQADGELSIQKFELAMPQQDIHLKDNLSLQLAAGGQTDFAEKNRLDTATLILQAGEDRIEARLLQPVVDFEGGGSWSLDVKVQGQLAHWTPRLRPWVALDDWNPAGSYLLAVQGTGSAHAIDIRHAQLTVQQLRIQGHGFDVLEPKLDLVAAGRWDGKTGRLDLDRAALTGTNLAIQADNLVYNPASEETPASMSADLTYQGAIDQLLRWLASGETPPSWRVVGNVAGKASIRQSGDLITAGVDTTVTNLVATNASGKRIARPEVRLVAQGNYDIRQGLLQLADARLTTDGFACAADGRLDGSGEPMNLQLAGRADYDFQKLADLLQPYLGESVWVVGRGSQPLTYRGPFDLATAEAQAGFGWASVGAYGFRGGPAELKATLSGGLLRIQPIQMALNEGQLDLAATVRVAPAPMELNVQRGSAARQIRIDPAMCAHALQYIAPVLAGVASAEGRFSIELDECRIPLAAPAEGDLKGRFIIHSVEVGPGPLVRELAILLGGASPARLTRESVVPFQMANGRIYHQGLELVFPGLTIRTHGSVGLDHTLLLMAEMPVPPKWTAGNPRLASALRNQRIQLPINGTLERPRIDRRALDRLSKQFVQKAVENTIKDEVNHQLEKHWNDLFPFRK